MSARFFVFSTVVFAGLFALATVAFALSLSKDGCPL